MVDSWIEEQEKKAKENAKKEQLNQTLVSSFTAQFKMNWIEVNVAMPETYTNLVIDKKNGLSPLRTRKLIVLTNMGTVSDNFRLKMQVGEKEWVWFMGYEDQEEITHWMLFEEPI